MLDRRSLLIIRDLRVLAVNCSWLVLREGVAEATTWLAMLFENEWTSPALQFFAFDASIQGRKGLAIHKSE